MDCHSAEQQALLATYFASRVEREAAAADNPWSADGPRSLAPFVPCASGRIPVALRAARLTAEDVVWDLVRCLFSPCWRSFGL